MILVKMGTNKSVKVKIDQFVNLRLFFWKFSCVGDCYDYDDNHEFIVKVMLKDAWVMKIKMR